VQWAWYDVKWAGRNEERARHEVVVVVVEWAGPLLVGDTQAKEWAELPKYYIRDDTRVEWAEHAASRLERYLRAETSPSCC
jgi:hypothetical protein